MPIEFFVFQRIRSAVLQFLTDCGRINKHAIGRHSALTRMVMPAEVMGNHHVCISVRRRWYIMSQEVGFQTSYLVMP